MRTNETQPQIMLPSIAERQKIFYWLKKISSLSAWRRILNYYVDWANVTQNSVRKADENGWGLETSLPQSEYALILKCLSHCEEGVIRLSNGDKRIFKFDEHGEFEIASRVMSHWIQMLQRISLGENALDPHTPMWPDFCEKLLTLASAWGECGPYILEPRYFEDPALVFYGPWLQSELKTISFPQFLPEIPDPIEDIFVRTGEITLHSGIWEPVRVPKRSLVSLITGNPKPQPPFEIEGTMNYLHGGSKAPQVKVKSGAKSIIFDTTWRLIWKDERYIGGEIPEEEGTYRFKDVNNAPSTKPTAINLEEIFWANSGFTAEFSGRWLVESDLAVSITLQKGDVLPQHMGSDVRWVLAEN